MPPDEIRRWLRRAPFRPFRIHVLEAVSYEVRHPEQVLVKLLTLDYYSLAPEEAFVLAAAREVTIALWHITRLEAIPAPGPGGNGSPS